MQIVILGAGALGGYYGGRLLQNGADVTFLVRPARKALLDRHGLRITSPLGDATIPVRAVATSEPPPTADIVLLACKSYDLDDAIDSIRGLMRPETAVLPILNGMAHIDRLTATFGPGRVIGGLAKIQATLAPDGAVLHLNDWNEIIFGELDGSMSPRVRALEALFPKVTVKAKAVADIKLELWKKLVHLSTVATVTTLTRHAIGTINQTRDGPWLVGSTLDQAARIAAAEGYPMTDAYMADYRKTFFSAGLAYKASMLRDMEKGGRTEGEHVLGYMRDRAAAHGIDAPVFRIAAANVQTYEAGRGLSQSG